MTLLSIASTRPLNLGKFGPVWFCLASNICLFPAPIKLLRPSLPGELRLAPHAPSLGCYYYEHASDCCCHVPGGGHATGG